MKFLPQKPYNTDKVQDKFSAFAYKSNYIALIIYFLLFSIKNDSFALSYMVLYSLFCLSLFIISLFRTFNSRKIYCLSCACCLGFMCTPFFLTGGVTAVFGFAISLIAYITTLIIFPIAYFVDCLQKKLDDQANIKTVNTTNNYKSAIMENKQSLNNSVNNMAGCGCSFICCILLIPCFIRSTKIMFILYVILVIISVFLVISQITISKKK